MNAVEMAATVVVAGLAVVGFVALALLILILLMSRGGSQ